LGLRVALVAVCLLLASPARALDPEKSLADCAVQVWRVRDGLPGPWVRSLAQTPDGYLWAGTVAGLGRYDGAEVVTIPADGPLARLADIIDVELGRDGTLWILPSFGEPVCRRGRVFERCFAQKLGHDEMVRAYLVHEAAGGGVWVAAREGIFRYQRGQVELVYPVASLPFPRPNALHVDARGRVWIGAAAGLFVSEGGAFHAFEGPGGPVKSVVQAFAEKNGVLWVTTGQGLLRIDVSSGAAILHPRTLALARPTQMIEDRDGNVWIGGTAGLTRFRDGTFTLFTTRDGLPDDEVTALYEDREGSLWVGTRNAGIAQFSDRTLPTDQGPPSLRPDRVETVAEDGEGTLWFGNHRGLTRWRNREEHTFQVSDGLPSNRVWAVLPAPDGSLWVGTDHGLARLRDGHFEVVVPAVAVSALFLESDGRLWLGTDDGLEYLENGQTRAVPNETDFDPGAVRGVLRDAEGKLWAATGGGLARLENGILTRVRDLAGANVRRARALHLDPEGTLWIGNARGGILRLKGGQGRLFGPPEGVAFDQLYQMLTDDQGFLWVGSNRGILRIDKKVLDEVARGKRQADPIWLDTTDTRRDVSATRARQPGAWKARDGRLWFACDQGVVTVDPRRLRLDSVAPPVWIEELQVDGRATPRDAPHSFPPGAGNVEVHFAGVSLLEPRKVAHRYRLEGFDRDWVDAGPRRAAYYTNLPPGRYHFRVQARNADGVWNERGDSLELTLAPHYYQTVWFYALVVLALGGLVISIHRMRVSRVRAEYQAVLAERGRVARELHDSLLQGMSAVAMQIYGLRKRLGPATKPRPPEAVARDLEAIEEVVAAGLEETRRFVWNLREPAAEELPEALEKLLGRLTETGVITARVTVEGKPMHLAGEVQAELLRIAQEAVANTLKHAEARHIEARLCYEGGGVKLTISDDGRGFEVEGAPGARAGHFGLLGMRERAARLGQLDISSRPGHGTQVAVTVTPEMASQDV
jgi:ligand-binding sensor domain-containing protein/signal transduction histidine kinase